MEILIRLSGVQLGPYSQERVRQHISEGLLTLDDPAKCEGMADWVPLRDIMGPDENATETAPAETPHEAASDGLAEGPWRAPEAPPGITHLPSRVQQPGNEPSPEDTGALARKTIVSEPTAPIRAPSTGQSTLPISAIAPLASGNQATKKVSRAAMIKVLSQKTAPLPTKAINVPPRTSLPAPSDAGKQDRPGLVQALTAKTVPMRNSPVAPAGAPPAIQTTEPLPTRHIFKPGSGTMPPVNAPAKPENTSARPASGHTILITEPMPSRRISKLGSEEVTAPVPTSPQSKKEESPAKPSAPPTIFTEPMPTRHPIKHGVEAGAPPAAARAADKPGAPARSPETPPAALASDLEVPTVKIPPAHPQPGAKLPPPGAGKPAAEPTAPNLDAPAAPESPKPARRMLPAIIGAWALLAAFMLYYVWSPYHAVSSLRSALEVGDVAGLDAAIDFPSVRDSLKAQIGELVARSGLQDKTVPAGTKPPTATVRDILDNSVDAYVNAEAISALVNKSDLTAKGDTVSTDAAVRILAAGSPLPGDREGLASVGDFVIDRGTALLQLKFTGLGWKLKRVELRPDLAVQPATGSAAPLIAPVVDTFLDRGRANAGNGDFDGAIAAFTEALAIDPKSSVAHHERASARQAKGDLDGAISDYSQALDIDPQMAVAYNGRGNAEAAKNDLDRAISDFSQAIHFDATLASAFDGRGNARMAKGDTDGAVSDFTQAIAIDPNLAGAYSDRGFARQANGNTDGAITDYTQALALDPKSARTYFNRGLALQAQGNVGAAILDFNQALTFDPKLADAYYYRGNARSANHDLDGAIADYTRAVALNAKIVPAYTNRGIARQAKGDLDGAIADYTQALALDPKITDAYLNRSVVEAQKNDLDGAIADSTQALYLDAKNAQAYNTRGFAKLAKGNLDGALADLKQFCDLAPRDHAADHARLYLWLIAKAQNSGADADPDLSSAMESSWNSPPDDQNTKTGSFLLGRMTEADYLAAAASPDAATDQAEHCQAWYFAGMKRLLMGDRKGAIDAFHQCVATQQKDFSEFVLAQAELQSLAQAPAPTPAPLAPAPAPAIPPVKKP